MTTATKTFWYYKAQQLFKNWKKENDYKGECLKQVIGKETMKEEHVVYPASGGMETAVTLTATKNPFIVNLFKDGKTISL